MSGAVSKTHNNLTPKKSSGMPNIPISHSKMEELENTEPTAKKFCHSSECLIPVNRIKKEILEETNSAPQESCHNRESHNLITPIKTEILEDVKPTADELLESLYSSYQANRNACTQSDVPVNFGETGTGEDMDIKPKTEEDLHESIDISDVEDNANHVQVPVTPKRRNMYTQITTTVAVQNQSTQTEEILQEDVATSPRYESERSDFEFNHSKEEPEEIGTTDDEVSSATSEEDTDVSTINNFLNNLHFSVSDEESTYEEDPNETIDTFNTKDLIFIHSVHSSIRRPDLYLGLDKKHLKILSLFLKLSGLPRHYIIIVLNMIVVGRKIDFLSHEFSCTETTIIRLLTKTCPIAAAFFQRFILWPNKETIKANLPKVFKPDFSNVQFIIDCFEFKVKKPQDETQQKLLFSKRYKTSTLKYLISYTPDGFINFVSKGYGGQSSRVEIFEDCGFLEKLPPNSHIMVLRGFKNIESKLREKQCTLVRLPRNISATVCDKGEMKKKKIINPQLNKYLEGVFDQLDKKYRYFRYCTGRRKLVNFADHAVIITCALSNLSKPFEDFEKYVQ